MSGDGVGSLFHAAVENLPVVGLALCGMKKTPDPFVDTTTLSAETTAVQKSVVNRADPLASRSADAKCASRSEGSALPFERAHAEMSQSLKDHGSPNAETFS